MSLNETKISLILIPLIFFSIIFFIPEAKRKMRYILLIFISVTILFSAYRFIYNYYYASTTDRGIETYILEPKKAIDYIYLRKYTNSGELNRIPQILFAYKNISNNLKNFIFGVGAGNASDSFFTAGVGEYYRKYAPLAIDRNFIGYMLWECGLLGTLMYFLIGVTFFVKSFSMKTLPGIKGVMSVSFLGLSIILLISTVYLNTMRINIFGYLFWFLAGYLMNLFYYKNESTPEQYESPI